MTAGIASVITQARKPQTQTPTAQKPAGGINSSTPIPKPQPTPNGGKNV